MADDEMTTLYFPPALMDTRSKDGHYYHREHDDGRVRVYLRHVAELRGEPHGLLPGAHPETLSYLQPDDKSALPSPALSALPSPAPSPAPRP